MQYDFEWDLKKARANRTRHRVSFEEATTVFRDPLLAVNHTFPQRIADRVPVRKISSRKATTRERRRYRETQMRKEYDCSNGVRGKLYHPSAKLNLPVYLDKEVLSFVLKIAEKRKTDLSSIVRRGEPLGAHPNLDMPS